VAGKKGEQTQKYSKKESTIEKKRGSYCEQKGVLLELTVCSRRETWSRRFRKADCLNGDSTPSK
jgi:hypothetical protein